MSNIGGTEGDFEVLDGNGTDGEAAFQLPDPDVDGDGVLDGSYYVYARALGTPGGSATITTCAELIDAGLLANNILNRMEDDAYCSIDGVELVRNKGKSTFTNVTDELLTIVFSIDVDGDGVEDYTVSIPLFDERIEGEYWEYDNNGLRLAQLRFYFNED